MQTLTKADLIEAISRSAYMTGPEADRAIEAVLGAILAATERGDRVRLRGFGVFEQRLTAARTGRDPRTGAPVAIPAGRRLAFRAAKSVRARR